MQTMLETWERENPNLEWQSCWEHLIKHVTAVQSTVAPQVVSSCAPDQGNVERLALRSGLRDTHPLR